MMVLVRNTVELRFRLFICRVFYRHFYDWKTKSDTIYAPATTIERKRGSALGIVRVSGERTNHVIEQLAHLSPSAIGSTNWNYRNFKELRPRKASLANILDYRSNDLIDVGLLLWFPKPNSYTGEDICEFHVHGSKAIMTRLLDVLGSIQGLRPADPGEFTRRAVANKKLTLMQAESLPELIAAQTDQQRKLALTGLTGSTRRKYDSWIDQLVKILAYIEASIDFGEDELIGEQEVISDCKKQLEKISEDLKRFIDVSSQCRDLVQSGARIAILGKPNAGKSTLMNMLCGQDKSIVSNMSGTTRDVIEHSFELDGHALTLSDTAGLRQLSSKSIKATSANDNCTQTLIEQHDSIEREGIKRALDAARKSNLIVYLFDSVQLMNKNGVETSKKELKETLSLLYNNQNEKRPESFHLVINKIDMCQDDKESRQEEIIEELRSFVCSLPQMSDKQVEVLKISCKTGENIDCMIKNISSNLSRLLSASFSCTKNLPGCSNKLEIIDSSNNDLDYVNERHLALLCSTLRHLNRASHLNMETIDEMAQHVRESVDYLSRVVGHVTNEQVIDIIFRDFCIGK